MGKILSVLRDFCFGRGVKRPLEEDEEVFAGEEVFDVEQDFVGEDVDTPTDLTKITGR